MLIGLTRSQERNRLRRLLGPMILILSECAAVSSDSLPTQMWTIVRMSVDSPPFANDLTCAGLADKLPPRHGFAKSVTVSAET